MKITRDAFLYLDGSRETFAQCGSCVFGFSHCALMGGTKVSPKNGTCGAYIPGKKPIVGPIANLTKEELGYAERQVRCENCKHFNADKSECYFYDKLNKTLPALFDLDTKVVNTGCCNANTPKDKDD